MVVSNQSIAPHARLRSVVNASQALEHMFGSQGSVRMPLYSAGVSGLDPRECAKTYCVFVSDRSHPVNVNGRGVFVFAGLIVVTVATCRDHPKRSFRNDDVRVPTKHMSAPDRCMKTSNTRIRLLRSYKA